MKIYKDGNHVKSVRKCFVEILGEDVIFDNVILNKKSLSQYEKKLITKLFLKKVYDLFIEGLKDKAPYEHEYFLLKKGEYKGVKLVIKREAPNYIVFEHDNGYNLRYNGKLITESLIDNSETL